MPTIVIIGAGSAVFTSNLYSNILLTPALHDSAIALMGIGPTRLEQAWASYAIGGDDGLATCYAGADYVITRC